MSEGRWAAVRRWLAWIMLAGMLALAGCKVETFWSPDGKSIAYLADSRLRLYDVGAKQSKRLDTGPGQVISATWSPDGSRIAFYAATLGKEAGVSLKAIDPASGKVATLVLDLWPLPKEPPKELEGLSPAEALRDAQEDALGTFEYGATVAWSPDGKLLAYVGASASGGGIFLLTYPAQGIKSLAGPGPQIAPAWSPDGKRLAYLRPSSSGAEVAQPSQEASESAPEPDSVWLYDLGAGKSQKVCEVPGGSLAAGTRLQWSKDSRQIGLIAGASEESAIGCLVEARAGAAARAVTSKVTAMASWSPGLEGVVYVGQPDDKGRAPVLYRAPGGAPKVLGRLDLPAEEKSGQAPQESEAMPFSLPEFSPDGGKVALRVGEKANLRVAVLLIK